MSAAEEEEQRSLNDNDHTAGKDNMSISQAVSVSFSHSAASSNSVDKDMEDTSHANTNTDSNLAPSNSVPFIQESAAPNNMGLKSVLPSFRTSMNNDEDNSDDENSSQKKQQQHSTAMAPLPSTQHDPDNDDTDDDDDDDDNNKYAPSSSSEDDHGDDDDDDDDDSDSDDESDDGDSPNAAKSPNPMFTDAARAQRVLRNKNMQIELGLVQRSPQPGKNRQNSPMVMNSPSEPPTPRPLPQQQQAVRGMVFSTPYNSSHATRNAALKQPSSLYQEDVAEDAEAIQLEELEELYPHRQAQIMQLWSLLSPCLPPMANSMDDNSSLNFAAPSAAPTTHHVPTPIFITGPAGTGKSTIVRDVVGRLQESRSTQYLYPQQPHRVGSAYINCATLDRRNSNGKAVMDEILHEAYRQLAQDMKESGRVLDYASWRRRRKRKRRTPKRTLRLLSPAKNTTSEAADLQALATKENKSSSSSKRQRCDSGDAAIITRETDEHPMHVNKGHANFLTTTGGGKKEERKSKNVTHADDIDDSPKLRRSRRVSELADADDGNHIDANGNIKEQTIKSAYNNKAKKLINAISSDVDATATAAAKEGDLTAVATAASRTAHIAAASFGQELKETLFRHTKDCAFLILDQAEQLLSVPASSSTASAKTNFLAQLLLLPRTKGLNLTIIVITKSIVLEHSRKSQSYLYPSVQHAS